MQCFLRLARAKSVPKVCPRCASPRRCLHDTEPLRCRQLSRRLGDPRFDLLLPSLPIRPRGSQRGNPRANLRCSLLAVQQGIRRANRADSPRCNPQISPQGNRRTSPMQGPRATLRVSQRLLPPFSLAHSPARDLLRCPLVQLDSHQGNLRGFQRGDQLSSLHDNPPRDLASTFLLVRQDSLRESLQANLLVARAADRRHSLHHNLL